jgi:ribose/xylose/arabinose/galactoside ABC-type transport system permease subunit
MSGPSAPSIQTVRRFAAELGDLMRGRMAWPMLLLIGVALSILLPPFLSLNNLLGILRQSSFVGIVAVGMSFAMIAGCFDLSVGAIVGVGEVLLLTAHPTDIGSTLLGVCSALVVAALVGLANGLAVGWLRANSVVTTIGSAFVVLGLTLIYTNAQNVTVVSIYPALEFMSAGRLGVLPVPGILFLVAAIIAQLGLSRTRYGRELYAAGGNPETAELSGVRIAKVRIIAYLISALLAAVSGMLIACRVLSLNPPYGYGFEFDVLTAVMLGGMGLTGGRGSVVGTVAGALMLGMIGNGMNLSGIAYELQLVVKGALLVGAVALDERFRPAWQSGQ